MSIENQIASFIYEFSIKNISDEAILTVKRSIIDSLGVSIAGVDEESTKIVSEIIKEKSNKGSARVICGGYKTSSIDAALINGVSLHVLDFDDTGAYTQGHPSAPILPAVMALAEENNLDGRSIIEAYIVGVEIFSRISRGMPMLHLKGWHPTSVIGTLAAASAASKLLKLNTEEISSALSIAASMSNGLVKNFGTMTKSLHIGNAASNGILAAKLASKGFSGKPEILKNPNGFIATFGKNNIEGLEESIYKIGNPLAVVDPGINIKKYPSCSLTHRVIDAVSIIKRKHKLNNEDIVTVECKVTPRAIKVLSYNNPLSKLEAKFSLQFVVACMLHYGELNLSHFSEEIIKNFSVQSLIKLTNIVVHENWLEGDDARADIVTIKLKDGKEISEGVKFPEGNVRKPLSLEQIIEKFRMNSEFKLGVEEQNKVIDMVLDFDNLENISELMNIISQK